MYNAALRPSAPCYAPRLSSSPHNATQRFVCQFIIAPQRYDLQRDATQRNDLFVNLSSHRGTPLLSTPQRAAIQRNDLFINLLSRLDTALGNEPRRNSPRRDAQQLNATICLLQRLSTRLGSSLGTTAPRRAPRLNSTQRTET